MKNPAVLREGLLEWNAVVNGPNWTIQKQARAFVDGYYEYAKGLEHAGGPINIPLLGAAAEKMYQMMVTMAAAPPSIPGASMATFTLALDAFWMTPPITFGGMSVLLAQHNVYVTFGTLPVLLANIPLVAAGVEIPKESMVDVLVAGIVSTNIFAGPPATPVF